MLYMFWYSVIMKGDVNTEYVYCYLSFDKNPQRFILFPNKIFFMSKFMKMFILFATI